MLTATVAHAHWVRPQDVIAKLQSPELRTRFGIVSVERNAKLPRLVLIRVGAKWHELPKYQRVNVAEQWQHLWRDGTPDGIVAILDAANDAPLVNFDAFGHARLKEPTRNDGEGDRPAQ